MPCSACSRGIPLNYGYVQYRSKVSYHLSSLVSQDESLSSRDETLVSLEPVNRIFWNKCSFWCACQILTWPTL